MDPRVSDEDLACRGISPSSRAAARAFSVPTGGPADRLSVTPAGAAHAGAARADDASALVCALARAFARAVQHDMEPSSRGEPGDPAELKAAVQAYVARLKAGGAPPESVVVAVKAATASGALVVWKSHDAQREATALTERVVRWCVQAYYTGGAS